MREHHAMPTLGPALAPFDRSFVDAEPSRSYISRSPAQRDIALKSGTDHSKLQQAEVGSMAKEDDHEVAKGQDGGIPFQRWVGTGTTVPATSVDAPESSTDVVPKTPSDQLISARIPNAYSPPAAIDIPDVFSAVPRQLHQPTILPQTTSLPATHTDESSPKKQTVVPPDTEHAYSLAPLEAVLEESRVPTPMQDVPSHITSPAIHESKAIETQPSMDEQHEHGVAAGSVSSVDVKRHNKAGVHERISKMNIEPRSAVQGVVGDATGIKPDLTPDATADQRHEPTPSTGSQTTKRDVAAPQATIGALPEHFAGSTHVQKHDATNTEVQGTPSPVLERISGPLATAQAARINVRDMSATCPSDAHAFAASDQEKSHSHVPEKLVVGQATTPISASGEHWSAAPATPPPLGPGMDARDTGSVVPGERSGGIGLPTATTNTSAMQSDVVLDEESGGRMGEGESPFADKGDGSAGTSIEKQDKDVAGSPKSGDVSDHQTGKTTSAESNIAQASKPAANRETATLGAVPRSRRTSEAGSSRGATQIPRTPSQRFESLRHSRQSSYNVCPEPDDASLHEARTASTAFVNRSGIWIGTPPVPLDSVAVKTYEMTQRGSPPGVDPTDNLDESATPEGSLVVATTPAVVQPPMLPFIPRLLAPKLTLEFKWVDRLIPADVTLATTDASENSAKPGRRLSVYDSIMALAPYGENFVQRKRIGSRTYGGSA